METFSLTLAGSLATEDMMSDALTLNLAERGIVA